MSRLRARKVKLFLHDDSINTMQYVIDTLSSVIPGCNALKAESIAVIVHNKGKCQIYHGNLKESIYLYAQLIKYGLHVSVQ